MYCKIRPYLNKVADPRFAGVCSADIDPLLPKNDKIKPWYLISLLRSESFLSYVKIHSDRLRMPKLNKQQLGSYQMMIPDVEIQEVFERKACLLQNIISQQTKQVQELEELFSQLLSQAFSGQLTAKWRQAHLKELLTEMEEQAKILNLPPQTSQQLSLDL